jgi:hypothetical protein
MSGLSKILGRLTWTPEKINMGYFHSVINAVKAGLWLKNGGPSLFYLSIPWWYGKGHSEEIKVEILITHPLPLSKITLVLVLG